MTALYILLSISLFLAAALHICAVFLKTFAAKLSAYSNIGLHLVIIFELLLLKSSLETLALVITSSLLFYVILFSAKLRMGRGEGEK